MPRFGQYNPNTPREVVGDYSSQWSDDVVILTEEEAALSDWAVAGYPYSTGDLRVQALLEDGDAVAIISEDGENLITEAAGILMEVES